MRHVVLFHSVYGLRPAVRAAADRLRAAGHQVSTPDLYGVPAADTVEEGFALLDKIGQEVVLDRARAALRDLPPQTVLAGFSMGAGVAGALLAERPPRVDLLLPHATWDHPPLRPGPDPTPYARWLGRIHRRWVDDGRPVSIRMFEALRPGGGGT
ncbi:dienelactone hydrolase family protein, partial [Micromonospora sp. M51]|uniref:dienelactone hydrolase family protein n=1 Tax=Micromonospora sp. M51 TaxID=2824889 RepID=UPI001FFCB7E9